MRRTSGGPFLEARSLSKCLAGANGGYFSLGTQTSEGAMHAINKQNAVKIPDDRGSTEALCL